MHISIVTLFPQMFNAITDYGVTSRAVETGLMELKYWNPRDFTTDKHRTVDDRPYGGGPGMLMKSEPVSAAVNAAKASISATASRVDAVTHEDSQKAVSLAKNTKVIYLSPQGKPLQQADVESLAKSDNLVLLCGRYEGIDERVIESLVDAQYSVGDYVISGGELAAMILIDAVTRLQPGALGHKDSAQQDSFTSGLLEYPQYTRPENFAGQAVPKILLSGDHSKIEAWREKQSLGRTWLRRPDLLEQLELTDQQQKLLTEFINEHHQ